MEITDLFPSPWFTESRREELLQYVEQEGECWVWQGNRQPAGYGQIFHLGGVLLLHRVSYFIHNGEIRPRGQIDHLCRNRPCIRPSHLEVVSGKENVLRGIGISAINATKQRCLNDHPLEGENLYVWTDAKGNEHRICRECVRENKRRFRRARREAGLKPT